MLAGAMVGVLAGASASLAGSKSVSVNLHGANGAGVSGVGASCAEGGEGSFWHYAYEATLAPGAFTSAPGTASLDLDLHSDSPGSAWLPGDETKVLVENARGTVRLALSSGDCSTPTLAFDGSSTAGSGTWAVDGASGSYRQATGSGSFDLQASVGPGSSNPFELRLSGSVAVLDPSSELELFSASWASGAGGAYREALVTVRVANNGPGDAFGVTIENATGPSPDVVVVGPMPKAVGDIASGTSSLVQLRYRLVRGGPCPIVDKGCAFDTTVLVRMPDALDVPATQEHTLRVRVPTHER